MTFRFRPRDVERLDLLEIKPDRCPVVLGLHSDGPPVGASDAHGALVAWNDRTDRAACIERKRAGAIRPCFVAALILAAMATAPTGCAFTPGPREHYYVSRSIVVDPVPGDHSPRMSAWPRQGAQPATTASALRFTDESP
ncbi:MAG: hypothetical protein JSR77_00185 [Planctomycetes bacterium]|nr:hypothetical protein [Planctomycetota bacterium]